MVVMTNRSYFSFDLGVSDRDFLFRLNYFYFSLLNYLNIFYDVFYVGSQYGGFYDMFIFEYEFALSRYDVFIG